MTVSGLELWTLTITECGNGLTGQALTSPTGGRVSLMEGSTTQSWTSVVPVMGVGAISTSPMTVVTYASLAFRDSVITKETFCVNTERLGHSLHPQYILCFPSPGPNFEKQISGQFLMPMEARLSESGVGARW